LRLDSSDDRHTRLGIFIDGTVPKGAV